jgi:hypothetical protein
VSALDNPFTLRVFPMTAVEEADWFETRSINAVETSRVHGDLVGLRARHVKRMHAAMFAERVLRYASLKGVDRQSILALQQLEIRRKDREMQNSLLGANGATTLRQKVQIDPCAEAHLAAVTAAFPDF